MPGTQHPVRTHLELDPETGLVHRIANHDLDGQIVRKVGPGRPLEEFDRTEHIRGAETMTEADRIDIESVTVYDGELEQLVQGLDSVEQVKSLLARDNRKTAFPIYMEEIERRMDEGDEPMDEGEVVTETVTEEVIAEDEAE